MKICIVIPVHNEAQFIGAIMDDLKSKNLDVIVVDDGSTDGSGDIARKKGATVLAMPGKSGKGTTLRKGFDYIVHHDYDGLIAMDGDGQHDTQDIDKFVQVAQKNPVCLIAGNRMEQPEGMPWIRYCTNKFMSWLISCACGQKVPDSQCGYRYISCEVLRSIELSSRDFEIESEILIKSAKKGFKILHVPIKTIYSDETSHINPFLDTIRFFTYFIKEICINRK